ncbi:clathrin heavy chain linker domain-containing protein 1 isoform X2 [Tiliqua scincoides]|uniref:clathrin heavy chain linker domain-containing protein 1 isoform X2 n=1 Tax=Tiliqua scincoides TaxID=71010 RepID=UPI0034624D28
MCLKWVRTIEKNSSKIESLVEKTRMLRKTPSKASSSPQRKIDPSQKIPGLNHKDSLDIDALTKHLTYLQKKVKELKEDMLTKYIPMENAVNIEKDLEWALGLRDEAERENEKLKFCFYRITQVANVVGIWENSDKTIETLQNLISQMIEYEKLAADVAASSISSVFECDPTKSKEAEDLIEYIERFNELFSRRQYEAAAIYAANCPRGILRNEETMDKFRAAGPVKGKVLPLLMYCEALVNSSVATKYPLPENLAAEAIKCALDEERLDLVMHWVTLQKVTLTEAAGDAIYKYADMDKNHRSQCFALAQIAYSQCKMHKKAILCMCKQGQILGAMDYLHQLKPLSTEDYIFLLRQCPSTELIRCLTQEWNGRPAPLSLGMTLLTLLNTEQKIYGLRLLEELVTEQDVLEKKIVNDSECTVEAWKHIAEICLNTRREKVFKVLISILAAQEGVVEIPADDADAELMNHVFL